MLISLMLWLLSREKEVTVYNHFNVVPEREKCRNEIENERKIPKIVDNFAHSFAQGAHHLQSVRPFRLLLCRHQTNRSKIIKRITKWSIYSMWSRTVVVQSILCIFSFSIFAWNRFAFVHCRCSMRLNSFRLCFWPFSSLDPFAFFFFSYFIHIFRFSSACFYLFRTEQYRSRINVCLSVQMAKMHLLLQSSMISFLLLLS